VSIRYRLDPSQADTFAKGILCLHTPWRSLSQILPEGTTAQAHLQSILTSSDQTSAEHPRSMVEHYKGLHTMSSALEAQKEMDTALAADRQDVDLMPGAGESDDESTWGSESNDDDEEQDRADGENNSNLPAFEQRRMIGRKLMKKYHNQTQLARESVKRTAEIIRCRGDAEEGLETNDAAALEDTARRTLEDRVISFNPEQLHVFREFEKDLRRGLPSKRVVLVGPGGTGKSYLIDTMTMKIQQSLGPSQDQESGTTRGSRHTLLVKTAFTGLAASNIGGITLHSALECAGRSMLTDMTEATLVRLQRDWSSVKVLVIDEISFVSAANLNTISQRLGRVFPSKSHLPFGGLHVLMCGDPFQLSPVGARPLWPQKRCRNRPVHEQQGTDLYMECDAYFELTKGQRNHGPFYDALSAVRVGKPTASDTRYLNSRHDRTLKSDAGGRWTDSHSGYEQGSSCIQRRGTLARLLAVE